ncbi:MAG: cardiolipin synthase [Myxococcales bacterium]|nr:cardiolipin synthase [Myxococcales bacterium]
MISEWYSLVLSVLAVWAVVFSVYVVSERRSPASTVSWVLTLGFLPVVGFAVYYVLGPRRFDRKRRRRVRAQEVVKKSMAAAPDESEQEEQGRAGFLIAMNNGAIGPSAHPRPAELKLFFSGEELYADLVEQIGEAKCHINMEYYIWEVDKIGTRIRDALVASAARGVAVRLHLDGVGSAKANRRFWRPLTAAGGKVVHFNRLAMRRRTGNFRTHRKIVVIDGIIGYSGGMNVTDMHSEEFSGAKCWRDTHMRLRGSAARGLQMVFNEGWYDSTQEILEGVRFFPALPPAQSGESCVQVVSSGPDENRNAIHKLFSTAVFASARRVYLTSPYFVPDPTFYDALSSAAIRGADVRVLVPRKNDLKVIGAASRSYYPGLLAAGVRIFEYGPQMVHAKTLIVDDLLAVVGTANADNRSFRLNFEVVVASYEETVCDALVDAFEKDLEKASEVTAETLAAYSCIRKIGQSFARLVSPLL